jgi:hypothetical protein
MKTDIESRVQDRSILQPNLYREVLSGVAGHAVHCEQIFCPVPWCSILGRRYSTVADFVHVCSCKHSDESLFACTMCIIVQNNYFFSKITQIITGNLRAQNAYFKHNIHVLDTEMGLFIKLPEALPKIYFSDKNRE